MREHENTRTVQELGFRDGCFILLDIREDSGEELAVAQLTDRAKEGIWRILILLFSPISEFTRTGLTEVEAELNSFCIFLIIQELDETLRVVDYRLFALHFVFATGCRLLHLFVLVVRMLLLLLVFRSQPSTSDATEKFERHENLFPICGEERFQKVN
ncbi:hypothetical protein KC321_g23 [Hortaea werneckii]|nr:hypothetical protein KC321_g23 [Hortaea werneckii]